MHSIFEQEKVRIRGLEAEASPGCGAEFLEELLFKIELVARDWAFSKVRGEISADEFAELLRRKHILVNTIKEQR